MRHPIGLFSLLPIFACLAPAAQAQDSASQQTVIVTGKRQTPAKQAEHFVRQVVSINNGQLARFADPVCPQILGVPASLAASIEDRIRRTAAGAKVRLADGQCEPNLVAIVVRNSDDFIKFMRKRHGSFFYDLSDVDIHDAFRTGNVHAWRLIETRDEDGNAASGDEASDTPVTLDSYSSSPFSTPNQAVTVNAVVVFDRSVVLDKTVAQMADYIVMRALAGAQPPKDDAVVDSTILSLFDPDTKAPPKALTAMDQHLLASLYTINPNQDAIAQLHQMSREMVRSPKQATTSR